MAVDLFDLVDSLKREINPPGGNLFPNAGDDEFVGHLEDAFWEAKLDGMLAAFTEADGSITPVSGTTDIPREWQQLLVIYAGVRIVLNVMRNLQTSFRAKAGDVEYETQQSANAMKEVLQQLNERKKIILTRLSDLGQIPSFYMDAVLARDLSQSWGDTSYVSGSGSSHSRRVSGGWYY